jgi:CarD family transcriptional regulator
MNRNGFDIGEYVSYGINGMCNIEDIRPMQLSQSVEKMMYYILRPESNPKSTIFVPVNNQKLVSKMREPMTKDEINAMLVRMKDRTLEWEKDVRFRTESFHEILNNGVNQDLILMIRCLHRKRQELVQLGKKLPARDSNTLKTAERLVEEEFAHVLHIKCEEVSDYIRDVLEPSA